MLLVKMNRNKALALNSVASLLQQIVALVCGLIVPRLILSTFGSAANGTVASISQFISITSLIQGGVTGATRVAFYGPVATGDMKKASVVYKTSQSFYTKFALALTGYVAVLAVVYPKFVDTPFGYIDALLLVLVLGMNAIFESMFGIPSQLLMFADQKAYFNTFLQIFCTIGNAFVSVILIKLGCSLLVVKFVAALIFILRPIILNVYVRSHYAIDTSVEKDKSVLSQSNAALAKSIAFYVHSSTDNLVITACLNVMWVSVYSVHRYVVSSISNLVAAILGNTEALFGQMIARDEQDAIKHDVPMYARYYFSTFLVYPLLYLEQRYGTEKSFMESWLPVAGIALCLRMLNCLVYDVTGTALFPTLIAGQIRGGHSTSICGAIENIYLIYSFYLLLKCGKGLTKTKTKYLIYVVIGLVYSIRFVGSRIMIMSLIASMAVLWYGKQKQGAKKMLAFSIGVIAIAVFMQTPFYEDLLQTIKGASSSANDIYNGNTMSVRLYSLETLRRNWNGKPMGLAFYGTSAFKHYFVIGSNDDLGYLGNWYTMGWYCVPIIVLLIIGYLYTSIRNFGKNNAEIIYSMIIYLLITGVSLSFLDIARIDVVPFLLLFLQTWKWDGDNLEELGYDG